MNPPEWTEGAIHQFLQSNRQYGPWLKLGEAAQGVDDPQLLKSIIHNVCSLVDNKSSQLQQRKKEELANRKRKRPLVDENVADSNRLESHDKESKRVKTDNFEYLTHEKSGFMSPENEYPQKSATLSQTAATTASLKSKDSNNFEDVCLGRRGKTEQLRLANILLNLCNLIIDLLKINKDVTDVLDVNIKLISYRPLTFFARVFVGAIWPWYMERALPSVDEIEHLVQEDIMVLQEPQFEARKTRAKDEAFRIIYQSVTTREGLEDLRSLLYKFVKIYTHWVYQYNSRVRDLIAFANINLDNTTPTRRGILEKTADLPKTVQRLCDVRTIPPGVDEMRAMFEDLLDGRVNLEDYEPLLIKHLLMTAWNATSDNAAPLDATYEKQAISNQLENHFARHQKFLDKVEAEKLQAENEATRKEEDRRREAMLRLEKAKPIIQYLLDAEERYPGTLNSQGIKVINPCAILGVPHAYVNRITAKKIKMKIQTCLHPDKFNLDWLPPESREIWLTKINRAFHLVTNALSELQKYTEQTSRWALSPPVNCPPYAEEIGIVWTVLTPNPFISQESRTSTYKRSSPSTPKKAQLSAMKTLTSRRAILAEPSMFPQTGINGLDRLQSCLIFEVGHNALMKQGIFTIDASVDTDLQIKDRIVYIWVAAPKLVDYKTSFKSRLIMEYQFCLNPNYAQVSLILENFPLIGNNATLIYDFRVMELHSITGLKSNVWKGSFQVTVPPARESSVSLHRSALYHILELGNCEGGYHEVLESFVSRIMDNGGEVWIRQLRKQDSRPLLESLWMELIAHMDVCPNSKK